MKRSRMFLAQSRMNEVILYCVLVDVVLGYVLKKYQGTGTILPLALLYLMNIIVILGVYRFWKMPIFEWDDTGFIAYSIAPFRKEVSTWQKVEYAGFQTIELKKGKGKFREFLIIHYVSPNGVHKTNLIPMYMVGFKDRVKEELKALFKEKGIKPL
jgi:hypothetical protein